MHRLLRFVLMALVALWGFACTELTNEIDSQNGDTTAENGTDNEGTDDTNPLEYDTELIIDREPEICDNGSDDDLDGAVDCQDMLDCCAEAVCAANPWCNVNPGDHLATVELAAPDADQFPLRFTIPVPPEQFVPEDAADGISPFGVVSSSGLTVPAQAVGVTRYADGSSFDVVELIARVERDTALPVGSRAQYKVVRHENDQPQWPTSPPTVEQAIANGPVATEAHISSLVGEPLILRAYDALGHEYQADLAVQGAGEPKLFRYGNEVVTIRTYNVLRPVSGTPVGAPSGALPHHLGVHAYFSVVSGEPLLKIDLRLSNASAGLDDQTNADDALLQLYFEKVELVVPTNLVVENTFAGPTIGQTGFEDGKQVFSVIEPLAGGKMHMMPQRGTTSRRLAICASGDRDRARLLLENRTLAISVDQISDTPSFGEVYSWNNPATGRYFPQRIYTPRLDHILQYVDGQQLSGHVAVRYQLGQDYLKHIEHYSLGTPTWIIDGDGNPKNTYPIINPNLGWAHPYGVQYGGMTGGDEIHLTDGVKTVASAAGIGYHLMELVHRMRGDRQSTTLFSADGEPLSYEDVIYNHPQGEIVPVRYYNDFDPSSSCPGFPGGKCDPFGYGSAPNFQNTYVASNGLKPDYEDTLLAYDDEDQQHLIRNTRTQMTLVWLGNDSLARDDLMMSGELTHFALATKPLGHDGAQFRYNYGGCLPCLEPSTPGLGTDFGRGQWHPTQAFAAAYSIADDSWRALKKPWFETAVDKVWSQVIIPCSGAIGIVVNKSTQNNYVAFKGNEAGMGDNAMRAVLKSVFEGADAARENTLRQTMALHASRLMKEPLMWNPDWNAPRTVAILADVDTPSQLYCDWNDVPADAVNYSETAGANHFETYYTAAYAVMDTGNTAFSERAYQLTTVWGTGGSTLLDRLEAQTGYHKQYLENARAAILACAQRGICTYP